MVADLSEHRTTNHTGSARKRLLNAAYHLFSTRGIERVGVDSIVAESGCAKASLYNNFASKEGLTLAFLAERERRWTLGWLEQEVLGRANNPESRLLAIFDVFGEWFESPGFEGCAFINVLLESDVDSPTRTSAASHLANIRDILKRFAGAAGLADVEDFAQSWHMIMKGSIVSAGEGNANAARQASRMAALVLDAWPRVATVQN